MALAGNPAVPLKLIGERLLSDDALMAAFAGRDGLAGADLDFVVEHGGDSALYGLGYLGVDCAGMSLDGALRLARNVLPSIRALAATARSLPLRMMTELSHDASPLVRAALARNTELSRTILVALTEDADKKVRECAAKALQERPPEPEFIDTEDDKEPVEETVQAEGADDEAAKEEKGGGLLKRLFGRFTE